MCVGCVKYRLITRLKHTAKNKFNCSQRKYGIYLIDTKRFMLLLDLGLIAASPLHVSPVPMCLFYYLTDGMLQVLKIQTENLISMPCIVQSFYCP